MKNIFTLFAFLLLVGTSHAQAPQGIPYQAAARNSSGTILASTSISVRFTIRDSVTTGIIKYRETHSTTTDANGMFSVNVGQGTPVSGTFASINWGTNAKFMQVELDPAGGSSYTNMGTQQMMSVPYALRAGTLKLTVSATGDTLYSGNGNYVIIPGISAANCTVSAGIITGTATLSAGSTTTFSNTTTGGTWSSSNTAIATVGTGGVVSGIAAGTATISYTVTNTCGSAVVTRVVTVTTALAIGASYGGGIIAYILQPGDPGFVAGEVHGLIAAASDQSSGIQWFNGSYMTTGASGTALGTGKSNTNAIIAAHGVGFYAAKICTDLVMGGYNDWFLPSRDELEKLYISRDSIGGFITFGVYWSSSEYSATSAWYFYFGDGNPYIASKDNTPHVRAVRLFSYPETIMGTSTVCVGSTTTLSSAITGGTWSSSNAGVATVNSSGIVAGVSLGTAVISYTATESATTVTTTRVVTVNGLPSVDSITGTATVSVGSTTTFSNTTTGGTWSSSNTAIATVGTGGLVSGIAAGTATISYTVTNTCGSAVVTRVVTVTTALAIGASYGGGKIAYILQPEDAGYVAGEVHGLIAAPSDQSTGRQWGCFGTLIGGTFTTLGTGAANTAIVSATCESFSAARLCANFELGGFSDWYLPSRDELHKLFINRVSIGGFTTGYYWSSSESSALNASSFYFSHAYSADNNKNNSSAYVRAVRSF